MIVERFALRDPASTMGAPDSASPVFFEPQRNAQAFTGREGTVPAHEQIRVLKAIMAAAGLHYTALASAVGVSTTTMRYVLTSGCLPRRDHACRAIATFVERNANVKNRGDVRFAP